MDQETTANPMNHPTPSTTTATPETDGATFQARPVLPSDIALPARFSLPTECVSANMARDLERRLTAALAGLDVLSAECVEYEKQNATLRADLERARKQTDDYREYAGHAGDYIQKIGQLLGCVDGDDTPELRITALRSELDASLRREGVLRKLAEKLMRTCYDEANRIANHCSEGPSKIAMGQLYEVANEAKSALGAGSEEGA